MELVGCGFKLHSNATPLALPPASRVTQAMAPAPKKPAAVQAEVALLHSLKNCLVNLPAALVSVLVNANTVSCPPPRLSTQPG